MFLPVCARYGSNLLLSSCYSRQLRSGVSYQGEAEDIKARSADDLRPIVVEVVSFEAFRQAATKVIEVLRRDNGAPWTSPLEQHRSWGQRLLKAVTLFDGLSRRRGSPNPVGEVGDQAPSEEEDVEAMTGLHRGQSEAFTEAEVAMLEALRPVAAMRALLDQLPAVSTGTPKCFGCSTELLFQQRRYDLLVRALVIHVRSVAPAGFTFTGLAFNVNVSRPPHVHNRNIFSTLTTSLSFEPGDL